MSGLDPGIHVFREFKEHGSRSLGYLMENDEPENSDEIQRTEEGLVKISFDMAELSRIKRQITNNRPYSDRMSISFAAQLLQVRTKLNEDHLILDVLDILEGLSFQLLPREVGQFRYSPLHPLWHVHWTAPRHILWSIGSRWNLRGDRKDDPLTSMMREVSGKYGDKPALWQAHFFQRFIFKGSEDQAKRGLTGDWIIFGKHEGKNYYVALATHEEGKPANAPRLFEKIKRGSEAEFPFLFTQENAA